MHKQHQCTGFGQAPKCGGVKPAYRSIQIFNRQKDINSIFKNLQNIPVCIKMKNQKIPHLQTLIVGNSLLNMLRVLFLSSLVSQLTDQLWVTDDVSVCDIVLFLIPSWYNKRLRTPKGQQKKSRETGNIDEEKHNMCWTALIANKHKYRRYLSML